MRRQDDPSDTRPWAGIALAAWLLAGPVAWVAPAAADTTIYYFRDQKGVFHFTNRPDLDREAGRFRQYRIFSVFRSHPEVPREEISRLARKYSRLYEVDPLLVEAVIEVESAFDVQAVSTAGAQGLMQIMPQTQKDLGVGRPFDPEENVEAGVRYLRGLLDRFRRMDLALAAYNAGPGQVERFGGIPPFDETRRYVLKVLSRFNEMKAR